MRATHEMRALPGNAFLFRNRGDHYGRLGRFAESLADRERLLELDPGDLEARFTAAIGTLYLDNVARYRLHTREMVQRFAGAGHPDAHERAAKALCLAPCDAADAALARDLADKALAAPHGEHRVGWFRLTRALVEHRAGDHAECLRSLERFWLEGEKIDFGDKRYPMGTAHALAAMAYHRLGNAAKAKEHFDQSARLMAECPEPGKRDLGAGPDNWVVWAILHREANQLLNGPGIKGQTSSTRKQEMNR